jgi:hypothetical protein
MIEKMKNTIPMARKIQKNNPVQRRCDARARMRAKRLFIRDGQSDVVPL